LKDDTSVNNNVIENINVEIKKITENAKINHE